MAVLPATGSEIVMGRVRRAYGNQSYPPPAGTNITLSGTLGGQVGQSQGTQISLSARFGGRLTPYAH
jgi:hypothetical protein